MISLQNSIMFRFPVFSRLSGLSPSASNGREIFASSRTVWCKTVCLAVAWMAMGLMTPAGAVILWNDPDRTLVHENGTGSDVLGGAVKRDDSANDTLYFKFHVDPLSDRHTEDYFAAFELYEGDAEHLGVGNALKAWAYSAFFGADEAGDTNRTTSYIDLHSSRPESLTGT